MSFRTEVEETLGEIRLMLNEKNRAYGDAALNPIRVFSKADDLEQLRVRIDDKLSRISRGQEVGEDVIKDLIGYLVLYRIRQRRNENGVTSETE